MSATTTTTEVSSNSNSSCRLLVCLNTLPSHDQRVFRSLLVPIELLHLSACCHSLRSSIRNDTVLWQERYHRDFLSGAYYDKEMDFILWCVRTDVNNPCTSDKRADLLENVDWYNTYRRRVSTENNWRYGRYNTTRIDMEADEDGVRYREDVNDNRVFITRQARSDETSGHNYTLEYLPHPNLRASNNIMYNSTFSTSPNVLFLSSNNGERHTYFFSDYYIAQSHKIPKNNTSHGIMLRSRKQNSAVNTFSAPMAHQVESIQEKWMLLIAKSPGLLGKSYIPRITGIMVFDIDNSIMCPGSIDDTWDATCFYKTTNDTATLYTARLVKDDTDRIEWALYQFSSNNPVVQLRSGWFYLPEIQTKRLLFAFNSSGSHVIVQLISRAYRYPFVIHDVALGGQCSTPQNCYTISDNYLPVPLLQLGFRCLTLVNGSVKIWTDLSYSDDQILQFPGATLYHHVMGNLYLVVTEKNTTESRLLVDITTKETIRRLKPIDSGERINVCTMAGTICSSDDMHTLVIEEYGEL